MHIKPIPKLLHTIEAAKILGVSKAWLERKRWEGAGPVFVRHGRAVRYELEALEQWINTHRVTPCIGGTK
jgi:predicted DNA-binding transcriptional regulator AlpA